MKYNGRSWTVVRCAKPVRFDAGDADWQDSKVVEDNAYDLIEGDDPDSFDARFEFRVPGHWLRVR